jgi:UDPglucose 6-dehydrogenase
VPTVGVGGHCLPKDGILLWWRGLEAGLPTGRSLILEARHVNDASPAETVALAERRFGDLAGRSVALLGAAYRFDSEDTRNSPTLVLARLLAAKGCTVKIHDPYVKADDQNLLRFGLADRFTGDLEAALGDAQVAFVCAAHQVYVDAPGELARLGKKLEGVLDGCNAFRRESFSGAPFGYAGIGRGRQAPSPALVEAVLDSFRAVERGVANEVLGLLEFLNGRYARDEFNQARFPVVQKLAATCGTGCAVVDPGRIESVASFGDFSSRLVRAATAA